MKLRKLVLLTVAASVLTLGTGCEVLVDFDRNKIDAAMMGDTGTPDACTALCGDSGDDSGDNDSGTMDAAVDAGGDATVDAAMDAADNDSGV